MKEAPRLFRFNGYGLALHERHLMSEMGHTLPRRSLAGAAASGRADPPPSCPLLGVYRRIRPRQYEAMRMSGISVYLWHRNPLLQSFYVPPNVARATRRPGANGRECCNTRQSIKNSTNRWTISSSERAGSTNVPPDTLVASGDIVIAIRKKP
jgi:hypothetical protein